MVHRLTPEQRQVASRMIRSRLVDASRHLRQTPVVSDGLGRWRAALSTSARSVQMAEALSWLDCYIRPAIEQKDDPELSHRAAHAFDALRLYTRTQSGQTDDRLNAILKERGLARSTFARRIAFGVRLIKQGLINDNKIVISPVHEETET